MAINRVEINKNLIEWAITRAGYDLDDYQVNNPDVADWLSDRKKPTTKQLEKFSHKVHVPFGYLFLDTPPQEELHFPFFRTGQTATREVSLNVYDAIQIVQKRQDWLRDYLEEEEYPLLAFVGKFSVEDDFRDIVADIRRTLNLEINWANKRDTFQKALDFLTERIEEVGVVVNFSGVVGHNPRRKIKVNECRGFVLVDEYAPFLFVNSADAKAAQMFTIVHELAHIWIGESVGFDNQRLIPSDAPIEKLCDRVAAEFLVPQEYLLTLWKEEKRFEKLNKIFKVSPIVIARRAMDLELISRAAYFKFYNDYMGKIATISKNRGSGGDFYATAKKRTSLRFAAFVNHAVKEQKLLYRDAYKLTGLKGDTYANFTKEYLYQL